MAGLALKDRDGNTIEYGNPEMIDAQYQNSDGSKRLYRYTRLSQISSYLVTPAENDGSGIVRYTVVDYLYPFKLDDWFMTEFTDKQFTEHGYYVEYDDTYRIIVFLTTKGLTKGETYYITDMY